MIPVSIPDSYFLTSVTQFMRQTQFRKEGCDPLLLVCRVIKCDAQREDLGFSLTLLFLYKGPKTTAGSGLYKDSPEAL